MAEYLTGNCEEAPAVCLTDDPRAPQVSRRVI